MTSDTDTQIDYEGLAQKAMRSVVRDVLIETAKSGALPGDHHFYISFDTQHAGVTLSKRLQERYPQEMTIVLQHRFWDLIIKDDYFEVKLSFDTIPERLVVPFAAIKVFFDPSVRYGLQFEEPEISGQTLEETMASLEDGVREQTVDAAPTPLTSIRNASTNSSDNEADGEDGSVRPENPESLPEAKPAFEKTSNGEADEIVNEDAEADDGRVGGAEIVSLDAFRKK